MGAPLLVLHPSASMGIRRRREADQGEQVAAPEEAVAWRKSRRRPWVVGFGERGRNASVRRGTRGRPGEKHVACLSKCPKEFFHETVCTLYPILSSFTLNYFHDSNIWSLYDNKTNASFKLVYSHPNFIKIEHNYINFFFFRFISFINDKYFF